MLTSKERAELRSAANRMSPIFQVGKNGIEDNLIKQIDDALTARELIKIRVLDTADSSAREAAEEIADAVNAEVVQVVGYVVTLFRKNFDKN